jgi:hypothetical protein
LAFLLEWLEVDHGVNSSPQEPSLMVVVEADDPLRKRGVSVPAVPAVFTTPKMCAA